MELAAFVLYLIASPIHVWFSVLIKGEYIASNKDCLFIFYVAFK